MNFGRLCGLDPELHRLVSSQGGMSIDIYTLLGILIIAYIVFSCLEQMREKR